MTGMRSGASIPELAPAEVAPSGGAGDKHDGRFIQALAFWGAAIPQLLLQKPSRSPAQRERAAARASWAASAPPPPRNPQNLSDLGPRSPRIPQQLALLCSEKEERHTSQESDVTADSLGPCVKVASAGFRDCMKPWTDVRL